MERLAPFERLAANHQDLRPPPALSGPLRPSCCPYPAASSAASHAPRLAGALAATVALLARDAGLRLRAQLL
eukprot:2307476-Prymnesium_polylepis.1